MYTALDGESYETSALAAGADDYILKKTSIPRLIARIHAHLDRETRREGRKPSTQRRISIGRFILDREARVLEGDLKVLKLTEKETKLLDLLSSNPDHIYAVPKILERVWGHDYRKSEDALHAMVKRLRQKIEQEWGMKGLVDNCHGRGFKLNLQVVAQKV
jgi:DNA-binding response OmpR family regulator